MSEAKLLTREELLRLKDRVASGDFDMLVSAFGHAMRHLAAMVPAEPHLVTVQERRAAERARVATWVIVESIGAVGPEDVDAAARRVVAALDAAITRAETVTADARG